MRRGWLVLLVLLVGPGAARAATLEELVKRADTVLRGQSSAGVFTMEIKTASYERSFEIVVWDESRGEERTLVKILGPALWRGHGTLKLGNQLKLYNPRTNHVTVVSHSMLGDSWMGSHFSNDDLVKETRLARDYAIRELKQWRARNELGQQVTFHLAELTPKPTAPVPWGKIVYEIRERGELVLPTRADYFRKASDATPERHLRFGDVKRLGGREVPARMEMTVTRKPGEHTRIIYKSITFDLKIPDSKFTEQALRH